MIRSPDSLKPRKMYSRSSARSLDGTNIRLKSYRRLLRTCQCWRTRWKPPRSTSHKCSLSESISISSILQSILLEAVLFKLIRILWITRRGFLHSSNMRGKHLRAASYFLTKLTTRYLILTMKTKTKLFLILNQLNKLRTHSQIRSRPRKVK